MYAAVPSSTPTPLTRAGEVMVGDIESATGPVFDIAIGSASLASPLGGHPKPAINGQLKTGHFE
jgi:hypothetical protein